MTVFFISVLALLGGLGILAFIRSRLQRIKEGLFYQVFTALDRAYRQTIEDMERHDLNTVAARQLFDQRANRVVALYWLQIYGGKELVLHWEYATFRQIIGRFRKLIRGSAG